MLKSLIIATVLCWAVVRAEELPNEFIFTPIADADPHPSDNLFNKLFFDATNLFDRWFGYHLDDPETPKPENDNTHTEQTNFENTVELETIFRDAENDTFAKLDSSQMLPIAFDENEMNAFHQNAESTKTVQVCGYENYHRLSWRNQLLGLDYKLQLIVISGATIFVNFVIFSSVYLLCIILHVCRADRTAGRTEPTEKMVDAMSVESLPSYAEACAVTNPNHLVIEV